MHVPIKTLLSSSKYSQGHFLAKSGICFKSMEKENYIYGFGFNEISEKAKKASQFEALERLYATRAFHQNIEHFEGHSLEAPNKNKIFHPSEVLISNLSTFTTKSADANGLGCHYNIDQAINHAILELIERHLLAEIWYENGSVFEIKEKALIHQDGWHIRFYTSFSSDVPLAIAVLMNLDENVWVLGSAIRESLLQSIEHATNEAFMLLESTFLEKGIAYSDDVEKRLSSLKDKNSSQARKEFFQTKTSMKNKPLDLTKKYSTKEIIRKSLKDNPIWIVPLFKAISINVVRAMCNFAKNPRWFRGLCSELIPSDPFC